MPRTLWVAGWAALAGGCLDATPYSPIGYHCEGDVDCPAPTYCFRQRCAPTTATPPRPTAENTGVPPDTALTLSGGLRLEREGAVVEGLDIEGCVEIHARNVTLRRSRIRCSGFYPVRVFDEATGTLLEDLEVDGGGFPEARLVVLAHGIGRRLDLHGGGAGALLGSGAQLEGSWVHDLAGARVTGVGSNGGSGLRVFGNAVDVRGTRTGNAVYLDGSLGKLTQVRVEKNWLNGGLNIVRLGGGSMGSEDVVARQNRFGRDFVDAPLYLDPGAVAVENVFDDTGEAVIP